MWTWTLGVMGSSSAAGGEQPDQGGRGIPPDGVVDVALLAPTLDQARAAQQVEMVRQGRREERYIYYSVRRDTATALVRLLTACC